MMSFWFLFAIIFITIWSLSTLWKRRKLYSVSLKLPGPFALPIIGSGFEFVTNTHGIFGHLSNWFDRYPGIFKIWFGSNLYFATADPKHFEIILGNNNVIRKASMYQMMETVVGQGLITARKMDLWKRNRKIITPTFNQKNLDSFMDVFVKHSEYLCKIIGKQIGNKDVDIFQIIGNCTLDFICETALGVCVAAQTNDSRFSEIIDRGMEILMIRFANLFYYSDFIFGRSNIGKEFDKKVANLRSFTRTILNEKINLRKNKERNGQKTVFLELLLDMNQAGHTTFTEEELIDETITFIVAGSDTTASTDCFTLAMLGMHQDIQERVFQEIIQVVGPTDNVRLEHLPQLKYLERVIKETLRLFPIGAFLIRTLDKDIDLDECTIFKDCAVIFGVLKMHRNEHYWPEPYKFNPDRFLSEEVCKRTAGTYIPFGLGPRNCIGTKYAMMAMKTLLATLLRNYRVFTKYKKVEEIELKANIVLRPKNGYKMSFALRI
ncbi:hypothetical protein ABEB36_006754 [Hypothenemus hampei]|uniref:Cytochrome P450 n=1 Tax=Hypothenemus hampei TaxID=57062 RepID=A0ABD1ERN1_HYPHA